MPLQYHPRIRGTNYTGEYHNIDNVESPPHTRDKYFFCFSILPYNRIIPAYAGQMNRSNKASVSLGDHPRIRGTNLTSNLMKPQGTGSSPHTRDKSGIITEHIFQGRIIPAYAGQIWEQIKAIKTTEDHPRIRGTNT